MAANSNSRRGKDVAASWATKLALTAAVLGSSVGANVGTALADQNVIIDDPHWTGMPISAKINVISKLEAAQHKVTLAPEAIQIKVESTLDAIQLKVESR